MDYLDDCDEEEDDFTDWFDEQTLNNDLCLACGLLCEHWGGDGLCDLEIEALADETAEYQENYVHPNTFCPVCGKLLTLYDIPADELWVWPIFGKRVIIACMGDGMKGAMMETKERTRPHPSKGGRTALISGQRCTPEVARKLDELTEHLEKSKADILARLILEEWQRVFKKKS